MLFRSERVELVEWEQSARHSALVAYIPRHPARVADMLRNVCQTPYTLILSQTLAERLRKSQWILRSKLISTQTCGESRSKSCDPYSYRRTGSFADIRRLHADAADSLLQVMGGLSWPNGSTAIRTIARPLACLSSSACISEPGARSATMSTQRRND